MKLKTLFYALAILDVHIFMWCVGFVISAALGAVELVKNITKRKNEK